MIKVKLILKGDLQTFLDRNRFLEENYANYISKVVILNKEIKSALVFLYNNNIIHRDLKPANIMKKD